jgi:hypothetical protein
LIFETKIIGTDHRRAQAGSRGGDGNSGRKSKRFPSPPLDAAEHDGRLVRLALASI